MTPITNCLSVHPYFRIHPGKRAVVLGLLRQFVERTSRQEGVLFYEFTLSDDIVFCREAYVSAEAFLAHAAGVGDLLPLMLAASDLLRCEIHGPAASFAAIREVVAGLNPVWFALECGIGAAG